MSHLIKKRVKIIKVQPTLIGTPPISSRHLSHLVVWMIRNMQKIPIPRNVKGRIQVSKRNMKYRARGGTIQRMWINSIHLKGKQSPWKCCNLGVKCLF